MTAFVNLPDRPMAGCDWRHIAELFIDLKTTVWLNIEHLDTARIVLELLD